MARDTDVVVLQVDGRDVRITSPSRVVFEGPGYTKLDVANYYVAVGEGALRGVYERPTMLKRYPEGAAGEFFYQKRVPEKGRPDWLETCTVSFPSGRSATELCLDLNPWPVRRHDVDHPDELRVDLDPQPGVTWDDVRRVALLVNEVLTEYGYVGYPKTSGSRGIHINVRLRAEFGFLEVRRAALALAREVERRAGGIATTKWWKEERGETVFLDYNQNARDRTVASVYSVRPVPDARVSAPLLWSEVPDVEAPDLTLATVPARYAALGDLGAGIDDEEFSLVPLLELSQRDEAEGLGDAPWPPNFPKMAGEPKRVQPSKARPDPE
jgi:DNA ligase D-like protein (predicted polymerase)